MVNQIRKFIFQLINLTKAKQSRIKIVMQKDFANEINVGNQRMNDQDSIGQPAPVGVSIPDISDSCGDEIE